MRQKFYCEGAQSDIEVSIKEKSDGGYIGEIGQGSASHIDGTHLIWFDAQQRDEMIQALQLLTFPGEELEEPEEDE